MADLCSGSLGSIPTGLCHHHEFGHKEQNTLCGTSSMIITQKQEPIAQERISSKPGKRKSEFFNRPCSLCHNKILYHLFPHKMIPISRV